MSGSGSTYFVLANLKKSALDNNFELINNLQFISKGIEIAEK